MKTLLTIILAALISSCTTYKTCAEEKEKTGFTLARVTFYSPSRKSGEPVACPNTGLAKEGITVAAHKRVPFGTKVVIPELEGIVGDGEFEVQDRGSAVNSMKASGGKTPIIDVYVSSRAKVEKYKTLVPDYLLVKVIKKEDSKNESS